MTANQLCLHKLDPDFRLCPNLMSLLSWTKGGWDRSSLMGGLNKLSRPQTMRRQRTEVVVELRKVNAFITFLHMYDIIKFCFLSALNY